MSQPEYFFSDPADTREEILRATYVALCQHGYADLSMDRIAEAFPKSKSLIYKYYDGKEALLEALVEETFDDFLEMLETEADEGPAERLEEVVDALFAPEYPAEVQDFLEALVELRAEAVQSAAYRETLTSADEAMREHLEEILAAGIEAGVFREVDTTAVAAHIQTLGLGVMTARFTSEGAPVDAVRADLDAYLAARVYAPGEAPDR